MHGTFEIRGFLGAIPPYFFSTKACDVDDKRKKNQDHSSYPYTGRFMISALDQNPPFSRYQSLLPKK